jgi:hypothetical protein
LGPAKAEKKKEKAGVLGCGACVEGGAGSVPGRRFGILAFPHLLFVAQAYKLLRI